MQFDEEYLRRARHVLAGVGKNRARHRNKVYATLFRQILS